MQIFSIYCPILILGFYQFNADIYVWKTYICRNYSRTYTLSETIPYFLLTLSFVSPSSLIFTHLIQMITDIHI